MAAPDDAALGRLSARVGRRLRQEGARLATAESCTGGYVAKTITDLAGSSDYFERSYVTYSNAAKRELLGVSQALLDRYGAVSEPVALAMARGALEVHGITYAVAVTGIAGPGGGTRDKPVGTVWIAWGSAGPDGELALRARRFRFRGDREAVRRRTVAAALRGLLAR